MIRLWRHPLVFFPSRPPLQVPRRLPMGDLHRSGGVRGKRSISKLEARAAKALGRDK